jgi:hypothetical protein
MHAHHHSWSGEEVGSLLFMLSFLPMREISYMYVKGLGFMVTSEQ